MTGEILDSFLSSFNSKMKSQGRSILLLLDNAGCHPVRLQGEYSNIKIVFLPPNTTSKLQPLDLGIICNFKIHYRRLLLQYVIAKIDTANRASDVISSINVLVAIRWVALGWKEVKATKCFRKAGILNENLEVSSDDDPFLGVDETLSLGALISTAMGSLESCSIDHYVNGDDNLQVCVDTDSDQWEANFMEGLAQDVGSDAHCTVEQNDSDNEDLDIPPPSPSFKEAVQALEDVQTFLENRGCLDSAHTTSLLLNDVASNFVSSSNQSTLDRFITP